MKTITLKKNEDRRIANGHLWAFSNEIEKIEDEPQAGDIVELHNHAGRLLGIAFYNPHSLISCRLLTRQVETIDFHFFRKRIDAALTLRQKLFPSSETCRLVHGESDFLPGLIVDKYNDYLSIQTFSYGMDKRLTLICDVLESILHPKGIIERNEAPIRSLEGLELKKGILRGTMEPVTITEYGIKYSLDLMEGQKTGFFLDQRENRKSIRRYAKGARVLDCFCNDGGFALNAAFAEATEVIAVDISESAIQRASSNAVMNSLSQTTHFIARDGFEYLKEASTASEKFDLIILDPPSFAKSKKALVRAKRGYKEIHQLAFQLLAPSGIIATASCSHHIYEETFLEIVSQCARAANRNISLLEWRSAAPDHPILPAMPETRYLKFAIFKVD
ncbi:MAG: class I SAM-dependent rRNA methyltransferase [Ignavibacteria bacterium]|nr:class I SAM-dependent rRNA methyltransferase [Ignavibacteria bacterium]MBI3766300.1 class I SAM-dependent rRNA methyltransferase [Ignavibacteriales bacterium]